MTAILLFTLSCFGLLLYLWTSFGGPSPMRPYGYRFQIDFKNAALLAQQADVRIAGVSVGKVAKLERNGNYTETTIDLNDEFAPIHVDARATLRTKSLLGETFVELTPGTKDAPNLPPDTQLARDQVQESVQIDEIFNAFDEPTRKNYQEWMQGQAAAFRGRGDELNLAFGSLEPFAREVNELFVILDRQDQALRELIRDGGSVLEAATEREGQLSSLISNADKVFAATASRSEEMKTAINLTPEFTAEIRLLLERSERFADDHDKLIRDLIPSAKKLSPAFKDLEQMAPEFRRLLEEIPPLTDTAVKNFPAFNTFIEELAPLADQTVPFLQEVNPILRFVEPYGPELGAWLGNVAAATNASEAPGQGPDGEPLRHLRLLPPQGRWSSTIYPTRPGFDRHNPYGKPGYLKFLENGPLRSFFCPTPTTPDPDQPECVLQDPFDFGGETTRFPHVRRDP